jgi:hypothetical protein
VNLFHGGVAEMNRKDRYYDFGEDATIDKNSPKITNPSMKAETTIELKLPY